MQSEILIVLGSPNSPSGQLSTMAVSRLNYCVDRYKKGNRILCTGGWGAHFNTSDTAHAIHAQKYLIGKGIDIEAFLDPALSKNTVDDAVKIKPILSKIEVVNLVVITSDYHHDRVQLIFNQLLEKYDIEYIGVVSNLKKDEYEALIQHEKKAIQAIIKNGIYF
ncbi:YdcF family protein [Aquimarina aquimarini]|uniref:YdcF family protein n=1 Tax=Aquimarina aquimarini TaxID=1191734 RepID=UPI001F26A09C|nr:YdcF family protein [Aquimarina aquimarini]